MQIKTGIPTPALWSDSNKGRDYPVAVMEAWLGKKVRDMVTDGSGTCIAVLFGADGSVGLSLQYGVGAFLLDLSRAVLVEE